MSPTHASTESARGEVQINRALSGDAAVRRAYCDAMCRSNVPATFVELAALASHLRRPITVIRGPVGAGVDAGVAPRSGERMYRARCVSEVVGARYAAGGRGQEAGGGGRRPACCARRLCGRLRR